MSTHTVYGCYIASTGKFEFNDTVCEEATITGCLVKEGEHAGQVEITHDYGGCETQYYACYDPATGKFSFEVDDGCCVGTKTCEGYSPSDTVTVTFSAGLTNCTTPTACGEGECECEAYLEGTWILPYVGATVWGHTWRDKIVDICPDYFNFELGCAGPVDLWVTVGLQCSNDVWTLHVLGGWGSPFGGDNNECFFSTDVVQICPSSNPVVNNDRNDAWCILSPWPTYAKDGTATVSGLC